MITRHRCIITVIVMMLSSILLFTPESLRRSGVSNDIQEIKPNLTSFSFLIDFDNDYYFEYFIAYIQNDVFSYEIWKVDGLIRKVSHYKKNFNYSLRQRYNIFISELDNRYYLIENDYSYGLAGYEYSSSTVIKKIIDGKTVIIHKLLEKTTVDMSIVEGNIDQFQQGSLNNPIVYSDFNIKIDESKYYEILNLYYDSKNVITLLSN